MHEQFDPWFSGRRMAKDTQIDGSVELWDQSKTPSHTPTDMAQSLEVRKKDKPW